MLAFLNAVLAASDICFPLFAKRDAARHWTEGTRPFSAADSRSRSSGDFTRPLVVADIFALVSGVAGARLRQPATIAAMCSGRKMKPSRALDNFALVSADRLMPRMLPALGATL